MMKRPSHCLIRRRCPFGTCMALICLQRKSSPNSADGLPVPRLNAAATDEEG